MGQTSSAAARSTRLTAATLAACYDRHGAAVFGLAQWITGDAEVAAQLTADVFAALRYLDPTAGVEGVAGCVMTDVHRRAVAWSRAHSTPTMTPRPLPYEGFSDLPDDERTVVAEAYFGGRTYHDVAASLDVPPTEVARLMQQALRRLGSASREPRITTGLRSA